MFIGNLIADIIGGLIIGIYSDNAKQIFIFAIGWSIVSLANLFLLERGSFAKFKALRITQETKMGFKSKIPHVFDWILFRLFLSYLSSVIFAMVIFFAKNLFS